MANTPLSRTPMGNNRIPLHNKALIKWNFSHNIFKCLHLNEYYFIFIQFSLKCVTKGPIDITLALVQVMAWHRIGDKHYPDTWPYMASLAHN